MRRSDGMGKTRISAPGPGKCPVCATKHRETEPHDPGSLYWQNQFYKAHRRFPTWEDALRRCDAQTVTRFSEKLLKQGIRISMGNSAAGAEKPDGSKGGGTT